MICRLDDCEILEPLVGAVTVNAEITVAKKSALNCIL